MPETCWCGNAHLLPFGGGYLRCAECETLVDATPVQAATQSDFYGRAYWFEHQQNELGLPDLFQRARADLTERDLHWLRTVLQLRLPPADLLELGSSHGGFTALLRWAGFNAAGLEVDAWVVDFARQTFDVPILQGTLESQDLPDASLDGVILMDVLEHLPDPAGTLARAMELLRPQGFILLQTPCYPAGMTFDELSASHHPFLKMLLPREHIYLFSQPAVRRLFERLGATHVRFERALFEQHDMYLAASRQELMQIAPQEAEKALTKAEQRLVLALLDLDTRQQKMAAHLSAVESDRAARLDLINRQEAEIRHQEAEMKDLVEHLKQIEEELHWLPLRALRRLRRMLVSRKGRP